MPSVSACASMHYCYVFLCLAVCLLYALCCSNSKNMPESVRDALKAIISKYGNKTDEEAECYLNELSRVKRYQLETWS